MGNVIARILLWGLILALLIFTAFRTLHFLGLTFPPDQSYLSWLGLAAFDGGVLLWFFFATGAASGFWQRSVSYLMIGVCMAGVVICTVADMLLVSNSNGLVDKLPPNVAIVALYGVIGVIVLNVIAGVGVHLLDPYHLRHMAEEDARSTIQKQVTARIKQSATSIAPDVADRLADVWIAETYQGLMLPEKKRGLSVENVLMPKSLNGSTRGQGQTNHDK